MLVLSRKSGESIRIGDGVVVTITEIRGGRVKVGISAPDSCVIRRGELQDWNEEPAAPAARKLASDQLAANDRRSATRLADLPKPATREPAASSRMVKQYKTAANRVRLAMELSNTPTVNHR